MTVRRFTFALLLILCCQSGGCDLPHMLGFPDEYMFIGADSLVLPGQTATGETRLRMGSFFADQSNESVQYFWETRLVDVSITNPDGRAKMQFSPPGTGDYPIMARCWPRARSQAPPLVAECFVSCREANTPLCVVDIDKTLASPPAREMLRGDPKPLPHSVDVLTRLAQDYTIVYLTERPDYLRTVTRQWLERHKYPAGPILMSRLKDLVPRDDLTSKLLSIPRIISMLIHHEDVGAKRQFKRNEMALIRGRFTGRIVGIGDQPADAMAYASGGAQAMLILWVDKPNDKDVLGRQIDELKTLSPSVQVVDGWEQIEKAMCQGQSYPLSAAVERLEKLRARATQHSIAVVEPDEEE